MIQERSDPFLYVSHILGRRVVDPTGRRLGQVVDLVAATHDLYPFVTGLYLRLTGRRSAVARLTAQHVLDFPGRGPLRVDPGRLEESHLRPNEFLVRDLLLDQQIVDVQGAKVERVNDVQLLLTDRALIVHVDVGFSGLVRRLGAGGPISLCARLLGRPLRDELISWKYVQPLAETREAGQPIRLKVDHARLHELHPGEMADILEELGKDERAMILHSIGPEAAADALEEADEEVQAAVISQLDPEVAADILEEMDPGEAADILTSIPDAHAEEIMEEVEAEDRAQLEQLTAYEEKTAAGLMTPEFVQVEPGTTAAAALDEVRRLAAEIEAIYYVYTIDEEGHLLGVTTLRSLFGARPEQLVSEIMETRLVTTLPEDEPAQIAELFQKYSFLGLPVVDEEKRMLGVILLKHAFDDLLPEFKRERSA